MTQCTIDWTPMKPSEWDERFGRVRRPTLLQHYPYAKAERVINQRGARHGVIRIGGQEAGLVQLGEVGLMRKLVHVVNLDRGPLWLPGFDRPENAALFFRALAQEFPKRFGRKTRILPELEDTGPNRQLMEMAGFARNDRYQGYETIWVDLRPEPERLRAKLDGNDALAQFATTLEQVCIDTVESGFMTKDLALLVGPDQKWLSTQGFLDKVDENLKAAMGAA